MTKYVNMQTLLGEYAYWLAVLDAAKIKRFKQDAAISHLQHSEYLLERFESAPLLSNKQMKELTDPGSPTGSPPENIVQAGHLAIDVVIDEESSESSSASDKSQ